MEKTNNFLNNQKYVVSDYKKSMIFYNSKMNSWKAFFLFFCFIIMHPLIGGICWWDPIWTTVGIILFYLICFIFYKIDDVLIKKIKSWATLILYVEEINKKFLLEQSIWYIWFWKKIFLYLFFYCVYVYSIIGIWKFTYSNYFAYGEIYNWIAVNMKYQLLSIYWIIFILWLIFVHMLINFIVLYIEKSKKVKIVKYITYDGRVYNEVNRPNI